MTDTFLKLTEFGVGAVYVNAGAILLFKAAKGGGTQVTFTNGRLLTVTETPMFVGDLLGGFHD